MRGDRSEVVDVFDRAAPGYLDAYDRRDPEGQAFTVRRRRVSALLDRVVSGPVLDLGCGPGVMADAVRERGLRYVGLDASPAMIREGVARHRALEHARFVVGDVETLPFDDGQFGAVVCMGVLEYLDDAAPAMREIRRVARAGAFVVMTLPNGASFYRQWTRRVYAPITGALKRLLGRADVPPMRRLEFRIDGCCRLLDAFGLRIEAVVGYGYNPFVPPLDKLFPAGAARVASALERLGEGAARGWGTGFVVGARVRA